MVTQQIRSCRASRPAVVSSTFSWDPEDHSERWKPPSADANATRRDSSASWSAVRRSKPNSLRSNRRVWRLKPTRIAWNYSCRSTRSKARPGIGQPSRRPSRRPARRRLPITSHKQSNAPSFCPQRSSQRQKLRSNSPNQKMSAYSKKR